MASASDGDGARRIAARTARTCADAGRTRRTCPPYHRATGRSFRDNGADGRSDHWRRPEMSKNMEALVTGARIDHLGIAVESIAQSRGFYEALGLRVTQEETVEHE